LKRTKILYFGLKAGVEVDCNAIEQHSLPVKYNESNLRTKMTNPSVWEQFWTALTFNEGLLKQQTEMSNICLQNNFAVQ